MVEIATRKLVGPYAATARRFHWGLQGKKTEPHGGPQNVQASIGPCAADTEVDMLREYLVREAKLICTSIISRWVVSDGKRPCHSVRPLREAVTKVEFFRSSESDPAQDKGSGHLQKQTD